MPTGGVLNSGRKLSSVMRQWSCNLNAQRFLSIDQLDNEATLCTQCQLWNTVPNWWFVDALAAGPWRTLVYAQEHHHECRCIHFFVEGNRFHNSWLSVLMKCSSRMELHVTLQEKWQNGSRTIISLCWSDLDTVDMSPDLKTIENIWRIMKTKVAKKLAKNLDDLQNITKSVWCTEISEKLCPKLVHSMSERLQAVIELKGEPTKY